MIRDHLLAIYDQHGKLTPELVVDAARDEDHPLHNHVFDCAPPEAAERYYLDRAHRVIQLGKVTYCDSDTGEERWVRAFHAVPAQNSPGKYMYEPAGKVAGDPVLREIVLREMEREWKTLLSRFEHFEEFADLVASFMTAKK